MLSTIKKILRILRRERFFAIAEAIAIVIILCAIGVFMAERGRPEASIKSFWDSLWWSIVTICTVGYGDKFPTTDAGRIVALILMVAGVVLLSLVTATIVSVFVEQKIREGKGLKEVSSKDHIIVCGWNEHTSEVLEWLNGAGLNREPFVVLINELPVDEIDSLKLKYEKYDLQFLRGNYANEDVLLRANIQKAAYVVIMADLTTSSQRERVDERTILAAHTIKSLAPKVKIVAELLSAENRSHLKRANVDEILIRGEHIGALMANAVNHPGLPRVFDDILSLSTDNKLMRTDIPPTFVGKTFGELFNFFKTTKNAILIGLLREKEMMKLEDMLSDDTSMIDRFIREKIKESKREFLYQNEPRRAMINPGDETPVEENDFAIILARQQR
ncbi:MAG: NAD-binding protein [Deltaproteobacteria bacterium]|nr:NAD-binding protein [Deltaproteobacteria bacterium]